MTDLLFIILSVVIVVALVKTANWLYAIGEGLFRANKASKITEER